MVTQPYADKAKRPLPLRANSARSTRVWGGGPNEQGFLRFSVHGKFEKMQMASQLPCLPISIGTFR